MMGGMGYATKGGMEEQFRAAVVGTIAGGSSEIQRASQLAPLDLRRHRRSARSGGRLAGPLKAVDVLAQILGELQIRR